MFNIIEEFQKKPYCDLWFASPEEERSGRRSGTPDQPGAARAVDASARQAASTYSAVDPSYGFYAR